MPNLIAFACILAALAVIGCAHQPEESVSEAVVASEPAAAPKRLRPLLVRPQDDARYGLPPARSRALTIFLGSQTFEYVEDGRVFASGEVSSGSASHPTPSGNFRVLSKDENKRSGKYTNYFDENTPMPYSLQFHGPYFVHEGWLPGHADSHGCVRLHYEDARLLFARIKVGDAIRVKKNGRARSSKPLAYLFPVF
jgi:lipoprotein-anchoring transpeptidase ErfK/SrfK